MELFEIEELLEELFPNYRSVDTDGSYLHLWVPFTIRGIEALPQFHIIISQGESGCLCLRLLTFHGKELLRNELKILLLLWLALAFFTSEQFDTDYETRITLD